MEVITNLSESFNDPSLRF